MAVFSKVDKNMAALGKMPLRKTPPTFYKE
jgi:hypothetical protein